MSTIWLRVTYRVRTDQIAEFQKILLGEVLPLAEELEIRRPLVWKTLVGNAGEFLELWQFTGLQDYESKFRLLLDHPRLQEILRRTGPMVLDENFSLLDQLTEP